MQNPLRMIEFNNMGSGEQIVVKKQERQMQEE